MDRDITPYMLIGMKGTSMHIEIIGERNSEEMLNMLAAATGLMFQEHQKMSGDFSVTWDQFWDMAGRTARSAANASLAGNTEVTDL